jgi:hypothetical protein
MDTLLEALPEGSAFFSSFFLGSTYARMYLSFPLTEGSTGWVKHNDWLHLRENRKGLAAISSTLSKGERTRIF